MVQLYSFVRWLAYPFIIAGIIFAGVKLGIVVTSFDLHFSIPAGEEIAGMPARF